MDFVDLIEEKKFLGQDFLTWLWWKSEERGGSVEVESWGDIHVVFEKHMLLEYGEGADAEKLICSGLKAELQEARTGLQVGKKLEQARLRVTKGDNEYNFTLVASLMEFRNIRLPKTAVTENEEHTSKEDVEGLILERIFLFEDMIQIINALFRSFLEIRLDQRWSAELVKINSWISSYPHKA